MKIDFKEVNNLYKLIKFSSEEFPSRIALSEYKNKVLNTITYSELLSAINKKSNEMKKLGLEEKSNIALSGSNSINWVITFFAIIKNGYVVVPIDPKMNKHGIEFILEFTNTRLFIVDSIKNFKTLNKFQSIIQSMDGVVIKMQDKKNKNLESMILLKNIDNAEMAIENNIVEILFTSGTTGEPKGVMLSHQNLLSNIEDIHKILPLKNYEKSFSILPLHHVYELTCSLLHNISKGNHTHFCSKIDLATMVKEMREIKPTIWPVVPLILEKIYKNIYKRTSQSRIQKFLLWISPKLFGLLLKKKLGLEKLKLLLSGGAALSPKVERLFNEIGLPITQGYGLSEASPLLSVNPLGKEKIGSVGKVISSCKVSIINPNNLGHGVIKAKGPNIFLGYYENEKGTQEVLKDGWLNTGDIGYLDNEEYLYITGREKFVIVNKSGKNIYPEEIEEFFSSSIYIKDIIVFSNDDENIIAIICPDDELIKNESKERIPKILYKNCIEINKKIESYKRIKKFYLTFEDFEKTSTQKIKRSFLKNVDLTKYILAR
ncbi:AMP-binding protein [bacterium]|jgi:long-chain acyl-CoA synthetase|nr:AMP-binding protein [bacterium]